MFSFAKICEMYWLEHTYCIGWVVTVDSHKQYTNTRKAENEDVEQEAWKETGEEGENGK